MRTRRAYIKCTVCGKRFKLQKEKKYLAEEPRSVIEALTKPAKKYECIDCPRCGSQHRLKERLREYIEPEDDCQTEDEEDAEVENADQEEGDEDKTTC